MANPITWQNVAAPDFSVALRGQAQAADLLRRAGMTASTGLAGFDEAQTDIVNQQAQANLLKYQDPAQLRAALESGALFEGLDQARIRPETMTAANSKVSGLLTNAVNTENLSQGIYDNQYKNAERLRGMEARPGVNALLSNRAGINLDAVSQLPIEEQSRFLSSLNSGESGATTNRNANLEYAETKQATSMYQNMLQNGMGPNAVRDYIQTADVSPAVKVRLGALFKQSYGGDLFGPLAKVDKYDPPAGGTVVGEVPSTGAAWAAAKGLTANESGGKTNAQNDAVGSGGKVGHFGLLQFGQDRLADAKAAGVIPPDMTPEQYRDSPKEVQNKVADWHFADIDTQSKNMGFESYFGKTVGGVVIDRDAIRGMAHLGGMKGTKEFLESDGKIDRADRNKTKISDYGRKFGSGGAVSAPVTAQAFKPADTVPNPAGLDENAVAVLANAFKPTGAGPAQAAPAPQSFATTVGNTMAAGINTVANVRGLSSAMPLAAGASSLIKRFGGAPEEVTPAVAKVAGAVAQTGSAPAKIPTISNASDAAVMVQALKQQSTQDIASGDLTSLSQNLDFFKDQKDFASDVTTRLMTLPAFKDADEGTVGNYLARIIKEGNVSPKVAGAALQSIVRKDAYVPMTNWMFNGSDTTENLGGMFGSTVVKEDDLKNIISLVKDNREIGNKQMNDQAINSNVANMDGKVAKMAELEAAISEQKIRVEAKIPNAKARLTAMEADYETQKQKFTKDFKNWQGKRP